MDTERERERERKRYRQKDGGKEKVKRNEWRKN